MKVAGIVSSYPSLVFSDLCELGFVGLTHPRQVRELSCVTLWALIDTIVYNPKYRLTAKLLGWDYPLSWEAIAAMKHRDDTIAIKMAQAEASDDFEPMLPAFITKKQENDGGEMTEEQLARLDAQLFAIAGRKEN